MSSPMSVNFAALLDAMGGAVEVLPIGVYDVAVNTAEPAQSGTGKLMYRVKFVVESGPYVNRPIHNNFTVSPENPNALRFFFRHMATLGLTNEYFAQNPAPSDVALALLGRRCRLQITHRQWNGQTQPNVADVLPPMGASPQGAAPGAYAPVGAPAPGAPVGAPPPPVAQYAPASYPAPAAGPPNYPGQTPAQPMYANAPLPPPPPPPAVPTQQTTSAQTQQAPAPPPPPAQQQQQPAHQVQQTPQPPQQAPLPPPPAQQAPQAPQAPPAYAPQPQPQQQQQPSYPVPQPQQPGVAPVNVPPPVPF